MEPDSLPTVDLDAITAILGDTDVMDKILDVMDKIEADDCATEEDLWTKLELPTPPLSPESSHTETVCGLDDDFEEENDCKEESDCCSYVDWHSDYESESESGSVRNPYLRRDVKHDCMWSGSCVGSAQCFRRTPQLPTEAALPTPDYLMKSETTSWSRSSSASRGRPRRIRSASESSCSSSCSSSDSSASEQSFVSPTSWSQKVQNDHHERQQPRGYQSSEFATPTSTITTPAPYPHSDHSYHAGCQEGGPPRDSLGIQTPSDSEEEIDVVTLPDKRIKTEPIKSTHKRTGVSPSLPYERQLQLAVAQAAQRHHRPDVSASSPSENKASAERLHRRSRRNQGLRLTLKRVRPLTRGTKRTRAEADEKRTQQAQYSVTPAKSFTSRSVVLQSSGPLRLPSREASSSSSSAGSEEDTGRRKEHNDMERKRRNDLKGSFQILRRQVPELAHNERAPKVQILTRASDYIEQLVTTEKRLLSTKDSQQHRNAQLRRQLSALQRKRSYAN